MSAGTAAAPREGLDRVVGHFRGAPGGPTVLVTGGIHGNEPSGVLAGTRVLTELADLDIPFKGELIVVRGNRAALSASVRYIDEDLNRLWDEDTVERVLRGDLTGSSEEVELGELVNFFEGFLQERPENLCVLDLHTSSSSGPPFTILADTLVNRRLARRIAVPAILGLEENLDGTLSGYFGRRGVRTLAIEGGEHTEEHTVDCHHAILWSALETLGCVAPRHVPQRREHRALLDERCKGMPGVVETRYRHGLPPEHDFRMRPGFRTFDRVKVGDVLADESGRPITALETGVILLPLYQGQGADGFFLGRELSPLRLFASRTLRVMGADRLLWLLPGVEASADPDAYEADLSVARWFAPEIFHLFGFRGCRTIGDRRVRFTRRPVAG